MNLTRHLLAIAVALVSTASLAQDTPPIRKPLSKQNWSKLHVGDIVFIRSRSKNATLIALLDNPKAADEAKDGTERDDVFTHCGIVFQEATDWKVLEGAGRGQVLTLAEWQTEEAKDKQHAKGQDPHNIYVRRWKDAATLTPDTVAKLLKRARELHNTRYDWGFSWTDKFIYCSELIWKAYDAGGLKGLPLRSIGDYLEKLDPKGPDAVAQLNKKEVEDTYRIGPDGKGMDVSAAESAVSPEDLYNSEKLVSVDDDNPSP